jgi:hypothetical protein
LSKNTKVLCGRIGSSTLENTGLRRFYWPLGLEIALMVFISMVTVECC